MFNMRNRKPSVTQTEIELQEIQRVTPANPFIVALDNDFDDMSCNEIDKELNEIKTNNNNNTSAVKTSSIPEQNTINIAQFDDDDLLMHEAVKGNNLNMVKYLAGSGCSTINAKNRDGFTPLYLAAINGYYEIFKHLIENVNSNELPEYLKPGVLTLVKYIQDLNANISPIKSAKLLERNEENSTEFFAHNISKLNRLEKDLDAACALANILFQKLSFNKLNPEQRSEIFGENKLGDIQRVLTTATENYRGSIAQSIRQTRLRA